MSRLALVANIFFLRLVFVQAQSMAETLAPRARLHLRFPPGALADLTFK